MTAGAAYGKIIKAQQAQTFSEPLFTDTYSFRQAGDESIGAVISTMKNPVSFLRSVGLLEAVSYMLLLFVAMPLKYGWDMPLAVRIVGSVHGALFVLFCIALWRVLMRTNWPFSRAVLVFIASLLPFVPFFIDRRMRIWAAEIDSAQV